MKHLSKITVVHYGNDYSGASVVLSNIINCLENKNIKVYYLSVPGIRGFYISPDIGICYGQRTTTRGNLAGIFSLFYNQFILFLRLSCDHFIHSNSKLIVNGILNFGALIYALIFRVDLVVYVHELNATNKYLLMFLLPLVKLAATQIICVSNFQKNKLFPHAQNCHVLYNCVNKNLFKHTNILLRPLRNGILNIYMLTYYRPFKGVDIYIKLAQSLLEYKALHFNLVLNERLDIVNSVSSRAPSNLSVHQAVADPTVFYEQADIIINATIPRLAVETFGLTLAEASVYGYSSIALKPWRSSRNNP